MSDLAQQTAGPVPAAAPPRGGRAAFEPWTVGGLLLALALLAPVAAVLWIALFPQENIWPHLAETVLWRYVSTTLLLMLGVGIVTSIVGTGTAWLVTMCRFPGRRLFEWALLLPLAMPAYIIAFVYTDILEYAGPVQGALRDLFGWASPRDYWFPEIRSLGGAIAMMGLVLYPYVYMLARAAFLEQSVCVLEASRVLGRGPWGAFGTVALPLARPAIAVGVTLALMETLNDFGTVDFFAVRTLTAGIYDVWFGMGNAGGAAQIASVMLVAVVALIGIERLARRGRRFHHTSARYRALPGHVLAGVRGWAAATACALPLGLGFVLPAAALAGDAIRHAGGSWTPDFARLVWHSLGLAAGAALIAVMAAAFLAYALRLHGNPLLRGAARLASLGYAVPGAVLGIGVLIPFAAFDNGLDAFLRANFGISTGLLLSGSLAAVMGAYVVRFFAVSFGALEASLGKIAPSVDMAARTLGETPRGTLLRIHLPLMRGSLLAAAALVFVDCMKELPATLILRPFNFETLATHVYQFASSEQFAAASPAALAIVAAGLIPVVLLSRAIALARPGHAPPRAG